MEQVSYAMQKVYTRYILGALEGHPFIKRALVMGGAPRDWAYNQDARDIDIYVTGSITITQLRSLFKTKFLCELNQLGGQITHNGEEGASPKYINPYIKWVFEGKIKHWDNLNVNIIVLRGQGGYEHFAMLDTFCFNLCKMTYDKDGMLMMTPEAALDFVNKTLTQVSTPFQNKEDYIEKIRSKFPDHTFIPYEPVVEVAF